jgi:hypothetical protein
VSSTLAKQLSDNIKAVARKSFNEEDLKIGIQRLIDEALVELGVPVQEVKYEKKVYKSRRADVLYPAVVLEYKRPHALDKQEVLDTAVDELSDYLKGLSKSETIHKKYIGIALDGYKILFVRARGSIESKSRSTQLTIDGSVLREPDVEREGPFLLNEHTVELMLTYLRQLGRKILDAEILAQDFGSGSQLGKDAVKLFYSKFLHSKSPKTDVLFKEWSRIFGIVYGENIKKAQEEAIKMGSYYDIKGDLELKNILFCIHTYFALLMKMLAAEVLILQSGGLLSSFAKSWSLHNDEDLEKDLIFMESGGLFKKFGISNFLEGDFFSWYLEEWDDEISSTIRHMAKLLSEFEPATAKLENEYVKDLLKKLYQYLVPKSIRHDLGEYYTPDWLAEYLLNRISHDGIVDSRFLDPACGSGTFLTLILKKIIKSVDFKSSQNSDILKKILQNVVGFDINPLAVLAARTNYLIGISSIAKLGEGEIEIPIYQSDSILTPRTYAQLLHGDYVLQTVVGEFRISEQITRKEIFGEIFDAMDRVISQDGTVDTFLNSVKRYLDSPSFNELKNDLVTLFARIDKLKNENRNHIWTRIIKNNFAPLYVGKFDFVIGNPPWIRWGFLSQDYRNATLPLWKNYGLFSLKGMQARLGSGEKDFSMLFLYSCMDAYVKDRGTLAFLITQEVVKSKGAGEGFRRFKLDNSNVGMKVIEFHDMVSIQPFEGASNKTGLIVMKKGSDTVYPVPYFKISKPKNFRLQPSMKLQDVMSHLIIEDRVASPVKGNVGSWQDTIPSLREAIRKIRGSSFYKARRGVSIEPYGVMYITIKSISGKDSVLISNLPELGDKQIRYVEDVIENKLVYPIVRGSDIERWSFKPEVYAIISQNPEIRQGYSESWMLENVPKTYQYLTGFKKELLERESYWKYFSKELIKENQIDINSIKEGKYARLKEIKERNYIYQFSDAPFYTMFNVSDYTFAKYRVIWARMANDMKSAVVTKFKTPFGEKEAIGTDTTALISFEVEEEAYFVCGILNSKIIRYYIRSFSSGGRGFGAPSILENISIPQYDIKSKLHVNIAKFARDAHIHTSAAMFEKVTEDEMKLDKMISELYQINSKELKVIQQQIQN